MLPWSVTNKLPQTCHRGNSLLSPQHTQPTTGICFAVVTAYLFHRIDLPAMANPCYLDNPRINQHVRMTTFSVLVQTKTRYRSTPGNILSPRQIRLHFVRHLMYIKQLLIVLKTQSLLFHSFRNQMFITKKAASEKFKRKNYWHRTYGDK